VTDLVYHNQ